MALDILGVNEYNLLFKIMEDILGINKKLTFFFCSMFTICIAFLIYEHIVVKDFNAIVVSYIFVVTIFVLISIFIIVFKKYMLNIMYQLSKLIASLIDMHENEVFSVLNDDMLSKLQSQVIKLSGILRMQNEKLKNDKNEIKSLITDISHQLKNPLANLKVYTSILMNEEIDNNDRNEYIRNINSQLDKLSWLMESMIKMSRLESGIIQLDLKFNSLNDTLLTSIKQIFQKASRKNIEIEFAPQQDIKLVIDKRWTAEAITNILDNAVKYTQNNGKIKMSIQKYEIYVRIDIEDTGIGIEEFEINDIFKRFFRGENAKKEDGVGIGLYLTREIITMQEGYIKVKSQLGKGSVFSVFLPM